MTYAEFKRKFYMPAEPKPKGKDKPPKENEPPKEAGTEETTETGTEPEGKPGDGAGQQQSAAEPKPKGKDKAAKDK
jgi:hypothetical protein